ncbi:fungal-specific transcription factor domain-containing protein [Nemania diffusa]|nr:fungal-specific transcription factor domain-containing protein [Nemania diffusa]
MVLLSEAAGGGSGTISRSRWPTRSSALAETPPCLDDSRHASSEQPRKKPIQLSWPDANDERRAKVGNSPSSLQGWRATDVRGDGSKAAVHIVNVSQDDLERHYALSDAVRDASPRPSIHTLMKWNPFQMDVADHELFEYFHRTASQSLAVFGRDPEELVYALVRLALLDDSISSRAVWLSLLAFSATHRHHVYVQSVEYKIAAIEALAALPTNEISTKEAMQHIAAGMLLCSLEIHHTSCTSGQWIHYIVGVKDVVQAGNLTECVNSSPDLALLLEWVYYHDVLLRFTTRYWPLSNANIISNAPNFPVKLSHPTPPALAAVKLLSDLCDAVSAYPVSTDSAEMTSEHISFLRILDWKIRNISVEDITQGDTDNARMNAELYKLAILVYLNRASNDALAQAAVTQRYVDQGFTQFARMESCQHQFPLFVLGLDARTDEQRVTILELISRTSQMDASRSLEQIRILMQASWAQGDLANGNISYLTNLRYVFSCCRNVPSFV